MCYASSVGASAGFSYIAKNYPSISGAGAWWRFVHNGWLRGGQGAGKDLELHSSGSQADCPIGPTCQQPPAEQETLEAAPAAVAQAAAAPAPMAAALMPAKGRARENSNDAGPILRPVPAVRISDSSSGSSIADMHEDILLQDEDSSSSSTYEAPAFCAQGTSAGRAFSHQLPGPPAAAAVADDKGTAAIAAAVGLVKSPAPVSVGQGPQKKAKPAAAVGQREAPEELENWKSRLPGLRRKGSYAPVGGLSSVRAQLLRELGEREEQGSGMSDGGLGDTAESPTWLPLPPMGLAAAGAPGGMATPGLQQQQQAEKQQQLEGPSELGADAWAPGGGAGQVLATAQQLLLEGGRLAELSGSSIPAGAANAVACETGAREEKHAEGDEEEDEEDVACFDWDAKETGWGLRGSPPKHPPLDDLELKLR